MPEKLLIRYAEACGILTPTQTWHRMDTFLVTTSFKQFNDDLLHHYLVAFSEANFSLVYFSLPINIVGAGNTLNLVIFKLQIGID